MTGDTVTVVSYNRPLTRSARRALDDYGIVSEESVGEANRWTEVELEREPPVDVLESHELRVDREPDSVYVTDRGNRVEIYDSAGLVRVDGAKQTLSPEDARDHAEEHGWELVE